MILYDKTLRRKIIIRCRRMLKNNRVPEAGSIYQDDDFKVTFVSVNVSYGDTHWRFKVKDLKSGIVYIVDLTDFIRSETLHWNIEEKRN